MGGIGSKAHGLTFWQGKVLTLDSEGGALVAVDTGKDPGSTDHVEKLWQVRGLPGRPQKQKSQAGWGAHGRCCSETGVLWSPCQTGMQAPVHTAATPALVPPLHA